MKVSNFRNAGLCGACRSGRRLGAKPGLGTPGRGRRDHVWAQLYRLIRFFKHANAEMNGDLAAMHMSVAAVPWHQRLLAMLTSPNLQPLDLLSSEHLSIRCAAALSWRRQVTVVIQQDSY